MSVQVNSIAKNTFFLYIRMTLLMLIGLYTSRVVLEILGVEDLGIYSVVGSVIMMLDFVSSSLINSSQRYLNIGLGKGDINLTNQYFSQSVGLHFLLSIIIVFLLETIGLWLLNTQLTIPENRKIAALWVYQLSVLAAFIKINQICYQSVILARENMSIYAYLSIFEGVAKLLIVYLIAVNNPFDKLIYYAFLLLIVQFIVFIIHVMYCYIKYPESKYKFFWDKHLFKEMISFVSINTFGYISWAIGIQGINILLNIFFGPVVSAARSLAATVERLTNQIVNNVFQAIKPQIIKSYARGEEMMMISLAEKSTVYIYYLILIVSLPILLETKIILEIWLKNVPAFTETFVRLTICQSYFWMLPIPYNQIATATGKIRNIQLYGRVFTLLSLPLSYILLLLIKDPYYPVVVTISMDLLFWLYTIYDVNRQLRIKFARYIDNVIRPIFFVTISLFISVLSIHYFGEKIPFLFIIETITTVGLGLLFIYLFGMTTDDITFVKISILKKIKK